MSRETILERLRRLRLLASHPTANVNEAAAAALAAERLIQEHSLKEAEITGAESSTGVTSADATGMLAKRLPLWQIRLMNALETNYQCSGFYESRGKGHVFVAYGRAEDIDMLRYQFAYFTSEITRLVTRYGKGKGRPYGNGFRLGAADAIVPSLEEARAGARKDAPSHALVVVDARYDAATRKRDGEHSLVSSKTTSKYSPEAYQDGQEAGSLINTRSKLVMPPTRRLGTGA